MKSFSSRIVQYALSELPTPCRKLHVSVAACARVLPSDAEAFTRITLARTSCRAFDPSKPVPQDVMQQILALTIRAPSGFNFQPYKVLIVDDANLKARVAGAMLGGNGDRLRSAPVLAVFAADLQAMRLADDIIAVERAAGKSAAYLRSLPFDASMFVSNAGDPGSGVRGAALSLASLVLPSPLPTANSSEGWAFKNTALAAQQYMLAATAYGVATHPMEGFDSGRLASALGLPHRYAVPMVVATGYPAQQQQQQQQQQGEGAGTKLSARLPPAKVFKWNSLSKAYPSVPDLSAPADKR